MRHAQPQRTKHSDRIYYITKTDILKWQSQNSEQRLCAHEFLVCIAYKDIKSIHMIASVWSLIETVTNERCVIPFIFLPDISPLLLINLNPSLFTLIS